MKHQNYWPHLGKMVHQLRGGVTLAYDLRLAIIIAHFKYVEYEDKRKLAKFQDIMASPLSIKTSFRA